MLARVIPAQAGTHVASSDANNWPDYMGFKMGPRLRGDDGRRRGDDGEGGRRVTERTTLSSYACLTGVSITLFQCTMDSPIKSASDDGITST